MTRRTRGREIALQVLYQAELNPGLAPEEIRRFIERRLLGDTKLCEFTRSLIAGVQAHQGRIDALISEVAENWRIDRMAAIDRNILRLGAYEMLYCPDVPTKVAINESLELAKRVQHRRSRAGSSTGSSTASRRPRPRRRQRSPTRTRCPRRRRGRRDAADGDHLRRVYSTLRAPTCFRPERAEAIANTRDLPPAGAAECGRPPRPHHAFRRRLLALRGGDRGRLRRPDGAGDHRPRHPFGDRRRPARSGAAGRGADRRGRADCRGRPGTRDPHPRPLRPRRRPGAAGGDRRAPRRPRRSTSRDGRPARGAGPARSTWWRSARPFPAPRSAAATWPTGWCGPPGRQPPRGVRPLPRRRRTRRGRQAAPPLDRGDRPDPGCGRGCRSRPSPL